MNIEKALLDIILRRYNNLQEVYEYVVIDNMLFILCKVRTHTPSFVVSGNDISYKNYAYKNNMNYCFNEYAYGSGLAVIDLEYNDLVKLYYFQEIENINDVVSIRFKNNDFIILEFEYRIYILYLKDLTIVPFGGSLIKICEPYIITFPYVDYFGSDVFSLLDTSSRKMINLHDYIQVNSPFYDGGYESSNQLYNSVYIVNDNLIYTDPHGFDFSIPIDIALGKRKMHCKQIFNDEVYDIKSIDCITPYIGYSLGKLAYCNIENNSIIDEKSSYVARLLYSVKYLYREDKLIELTKIVSRQINILFPDIDVIVPIPPSDKTRQPNLFLELIKKISEEINIPYDTNYLLSENSIPIKSIKNNIERKRILNESLYISDSKIYQNKKILLIDDHIYKGDTICTAIDKVKCKNIFVLVIARNYTTTLDLSY